ncbi:MAG TPA: hypothetical protein VFK56_00900 [Mycobacterium sp.]|nr:hypothetical protein [Mycobacterium sp.]
MTRTSRHDVECNYLMARQDDVDVDYVTYMGFTDLLAAVGGENDLRCRFDVASPRKWQKLVGGLPQLRNDIMHSTRELLSPERDVTKLVDAYDLLQRLSQRATRAAGSGTQS